METPFESSANNDLKPKEEIGEEEDSLSFGMQILGLGSVSLAAKSAVELDVFETIAKAGEGAMLSAKDIASRIGSKNPEAPHMLARLLGLLAAHSFLRCTVSHQDHRLIRLYSLSPRSRYFVTDAEDGVSLGPTVALLLDDVFYQSWKEVKGAIMEGGIPFNRVHGMHFFDYLGVDQRFNEVFNKAMVNYTTKIMKKILEFYKGFEGINTLVDVGGSLGVNLNLITSKYPHLKAINFDLPHVIKHAPPYAGVEHVAGDMFESVPKGDAIFMKFILHDWSDDKCLKLLRNCHEAIPDDGKVIVVERILPVVPETTLDAKFSFHSDVVMMIQCPGGKERTHQEFMELTKASGFSAIKLVCFVSGFGVMEIFK